MNSNTFGKLIPHLKSVCWIDASIDAKEVLGGFKYRLFILHGFDSVHNMTNELTLKVSIMNEAEDIPRKIEIHEEIYPSKSLINCIPKDQIVKTFLTNVDLTDKIDDKG
jgi:hypothetical protein